MKYIEDVNVKRLVLDLRYPISINLSASKITEIYLIKISPYV